MVELLEIGKTPSGPALLPHPPEACVALVSIHDLADRPPRALADGATLSLGSPRVRWVDTPHLPHAWECGYLMEERTRPLLCGDLFTQGGTGHPAITESDILGPSETFRQKMDYYSPTKNATEMLERRASVAPVTLACMHGSAWQGDSALPLRALAEALSWSPAPIERVQRRQCSASHMYP